MDTFYGQAIAEASSITISGKHDFRVWHTAVAFGQNNHLVISITTDI